MRNDYREPRIVTSGVFSRYIILLIRPRRTVERGGTRVVFFSYRFRFSSRCFTALRKPAHYVGVVFACVFQPLFDSDFIEQYYVSYQMAHNTFTPYGLASVIDVQTRWSSKSRPSRATEESHYRAISSLVMILVHVNLFHR